jgi:hypothetical protein
MMLMNLGNTTSRRAGAAAINSAKLEGDERGGTSEYASPAAVKLGAGACNGFLFSPDCCEDIVLPRLLASRYPSFSPHI